MSWLACARTAAEWVAVGAMGSAAPAVDAAPTTGLTESLVRLAARPVSSASDLAEEVRVVVERCLEEDAEAALEELRWLPVEALPLRAPLVRALGGTGDARCVPWITEQLDDAALRAAALIEVGRLAPLASEAVREVVRERVREFVRSTDGEEHRLALRAAVALQDEASIPALVDLRAEADEATCRHIDRAIAALSRRAIPASPDGWTRWLEAERAWSVAHAASALDALAARDDARTVRAIHDLSTRSFQRARWAAAIGELLTDGDRSLEVQRQACLALLRLASPAAEPALLEYVAAEPPLPLAELARAAIVASRAR